MLLIGRKSLYPGIVAVILASALLAQNHDDNPAAKDFQQRVANYMALKKDQGVPNKQTASVEKLAEQKQEATQKTKAARPAAHQGDIFTPEIAAYFKHQIAATMQGADGKKVRASLRHAEPLPDVHLEVNAKYPKNFPLQSTPPTLLLNLPLLPKGLQYRIVGSTLVLYDEASDLVVDLIPGAIEIA